MGYLISALETVRGLYLRLFGDFLHVHFLIRTVFLLLMTWLVIVVSLKIFKFLVGPLLVLMFYHVFFRLHNYFFVETPAEWIYIRYYSRDLPTFERAYLRLTDKAKKNRDLLGELDYGMAIVKVRKAERRFSYFLLTMSTLWIVAFGLYAEFFPPFSVNFESVATVSGQATDSGSVQDSPEDAENGVSQYEVVNENIGGGHGVYHPGTINPADWDLDEVALILNESGREGAWLRNGPGISGFIVTQVLWGDVVLEYLHYYVPDYYVNGLYWLRIRTPDSNTGYLASSLVEVYR